MEHTKATYKQMSAPYTKGLRIGRFMRTEAPDDMPTNPYTYGTIDAMEWDRGYNHGRFDRTEHEN